MSLAVRKQKTVCVSCEESKDEQSHPCSWALGNSSATSATTSPSLSVRSQMMTSSDTLEPFEPLRLLTDIWRGHSDPRCIFKISSLKGFIYLGMRSRFRSALDQTLPRLCHWILRFTDLLLAHFVIVDLMNIFGLLSITVHKNWPVKRTTKQQLKLKHARVCIIWAIISAWTHILRFKFRMRLFWTNVTMKWISWKDKSQSTENWICHSDANNFWVGARLTTDYIAWIKWHQHPPTHQIREEFGCGEKSSISLTGHFVILYLSILINSGH